MIAVLGVVACLVFVRSSELGPAHDEAAEAAPAQA